MTRNAICAAMRLSLVHGSILRTSTSPLLAKDTAMCLTRTCRGSLLVNGAKDPSVCRGHLGRICLSMLFRGKCSQRTSGGRLPVKDIQGRVLKGSLHTKDSQTLCLLKMSAEHLLVDEIYKPSVCHGSLGKFAF